MNDYEDAMNYYLAKVVKKRKEIEDEMNYSLQQQLISEIEKNVGIPDYIFKRVSATEAAEVSRRAAEVIRCHTSGNISYAREDASVVPEWAARKGAIEVEAEVIKIEPAELLDKQQET